MSARNYQDEPDRIQAWLGVIYSGKALFCIAKDPTLRGAPLQAKEVCYLVTKRSAQLIAASIIGILRHMEGSQKQTGGLAARHIIAVDGAIFTEFHLYSRLLQEAVVHIAGQEYADNFEIRMTKGGASFGVATLAAAGAQYEKVMGRGTPPKTPERKFPPRGRSSFELAAMQ